MALHEVVQERPLQLRAQTLVDPEARAGQLGAALVVDEPQVGAEVDVVLGGEVKLVGLAVVAKGLVVLLAAGLEVGVGQVGKRQHLHPVLGFHTAELLVARGNLRLELCHAGKDGRHVLPGLLLHGDLLGELVLLGLAGFVEGV